MQIDRATGATINASIFSEGSTKLVPSPSERGWGEA